MNIGDLNKGKCLTCILQKINFVCIFPAVICQLWKMQNLVHLVDNVTPSQRHHKLRFDFVIK